MREIAEITTRETYLRPKQHILTFHLDLEMMEMGVSWVGLVKESMKEKKISKNDQNTPKNSIPQAQTMHFDTLFGP